MRRETDKLNFIHIRRIANEQASLQNSQMQSLIHKYTSIVWRFLHEKNDFFFLLMWISLSMCESYFKCTKFETILAPYCSADKNSCKRLYIVNTDREIQYQNSQECNCCIIYYDWQLQYRRFHTCFSFWIRTDSGFLNVQLNVCVFLFI